MPSFFQVMKRMIQGKPIFDPNDPQDGAIQRPAPTPPSMPGQPVSPHQQQPTASQPAAPESTIVKGSDRTFPVVNVKRTTSRLNGANMQVYCWIRNNWHDELELDKVHLLGQTRDLNTTLRAGQEREFQVFNGPRPKNVTHQADIEYKTAQGGDYFKAIFDLDFTFHPDKTYSVDDLKLHLPIRDIYG